MRLSALLATAETTTCFVIVPFFLWLAWGFWRLRPQASARLGDRMFWVGLLAAAGPATLALSFVMLGGLSIAYPFDLRGLMHPPPGSLGAALEVIAFACLPLAAGLIASAVALGAHTRPDTGS